jgi:uncharacterized protein
MDHPNADHLRLAYGLRDDQEVVAVGAWLHDSVTWHAPGGDLHGPGQVLSMLGQSDDVARGTTRREVHALFADDTYGIVLTTIRAERPGRTFEDRQVHVYRFRDGKVIEFWEYLGDPHANEEFWSPEGSEETQATDLGLPQA